MKRQILMLAMLLCTSLAMAQSKFNVKGIIIDKETDEALIAAILIIFNSKTSHKSRGDDTMFQCDKCGACCMNLKRSEIYSDLDRGDGICIHFNEETKLCNIYDNRPDICNVDKLYKLYFVDKISVSKYYQLNYQACSILKGRK